MTVLVYSASYRGAQAELVTIEVQELNGLPGIHIIGLPDSVVKESRDRVKAAIQNSRYPFPRNKILINLAPVHMKKEGPLLDLGIAVALLACQGLVPKAALAETVFLGELSLNGTLRDTRGVLAVGEMACEKKFRRLILPQQSAENAQWIHEMEAYAFVNLGEVAAFLLGQLPKDPIVPQPQTAGSISSNGSLDEVLGQEAAKRALLIAAAGGHNFIFVGPPGCGKTMLARRFPALLPPPSQKESREILLVQEAISQNGKLQVPQRPFRAPHHSISLVGFLGGGPYARPGELSRAHCGVLFLDELPEFHRDLLEALRQPLEEGYIEIGRARYHLRLPAKFQLIAAMNPCPCGFFGHAQKPCRCTPKQIHMYCSKISGPLLDRIDLHVELPPIDFQEREFPATRWSMETIQKLVRQCWQIQKARFRNTFYQRNADMPSFVLKKYCALNPEDRFFYFTSLQRLGLSQRAHDRCLRVARTIADLEGSGVIGRKHLAEALSSARGERLGGWAG